MTQEKIARINELAKKSREEGLTDDEKQEQALLRAEYVASVRANLVGQLSNTYIVRPDGTKEKVTKKKGKKLN